MRNLSRGPIRLRLLIDKGERHALLGVSGHDDMIPVDVWVACSRGTPLRDEGQTYDWDVDHLRKDLLLIVTKVELDAGFVESVLELHRSRASERWTRWHELWAREARADRGD